MPARKPVKARARRLRIVAVISGPGDLRAASHLSPLPDLFELRLDCVAGEKDLERKVRRLEAPLIITARHPAEGGHKNLSAAMRRDLLLRFLPAARYVDVELRSARTSRAVFDAARRLKVNTIISYHDLGSTPSLGSLRAKVVRAAALGATLFKVATRTDRPDQLGRLLQLVSSRQALPLAVMGIGRLGALSRLFLARQGSVLAYTSLGEPQMEGQMSFDAFRRALRHFNSSA